MEKKRFQKGKKNGGVMMPTKSNNTGGRGGARPGAGRKKKALVEKCIQLWEDWDGVLQYKYYNRRCDKIL